MPILHVRALPQKDSSKITAALKKTTVAISEVYGCSPQQVWATWEEIKTGWYVEGESEASMQPGETHPPIGELTCFEGRSAKEIEKLLVVASSTLTKELGIEDNIFISYKEAKPGQVIAGNGIVRKKN